MMKKNLISVFMLLCGYGALSQTSKPFAISRITNVQDSYPNPSPDGNTLVFHSNRTGTREIFIINTDGSGLKQLTSTGKENVTPVFSPDGKKIVFQSHPDDDPEIYSMDADGKNQKRLTHQEGDDSHPHWSPDGTRIVFNSARTSLDMKSDWGKQYHEVFSMKADGTDVKQITSEKAICTFPSYSPDGKKIVFRYYNYDVGFTWDLSASKRNSEVYVVNVDGTGLTNLTKNASFDGWPCWSPDGSKIAFSSNRQGPANTGQVYTMNPDGTDVQKITEGPGAFSQPWWSKDGSKIYAYQFWETSEYEFGNLAVILVK